MQIQKAISYLVVIWINLKILNNNYLSINKVIKA